MTGYGQADVMGERGVLSVEARALNHRYLDLTVRLPRPLTAFESDIRKLFQSEIQRGRVEVTVTLRRLESASAGNVQVNHSLAQAYVGKLRELVNANHLEGALTLTDLLQCPGVVSMEEQEPLTPEEGWLLLEQAAADTLKALVAQREAEGAALGHELGRLLDELDRLVSALAGQLAEGSRERQERLRERIKTLLGELPVDEGRLAMEIAILADRSDVTEEVTRLGAHLDRFRELLVANGPVGRTLDFLIQEMNREVNTIGSKADNLLATQSVITAKGLLEKLREQVQNLE
jgi:uncharacterized protein (TIGR00255 family)